MFFFSSRRRHTRCALVTGVQTGALPISVLAAAGLAAEEPGDSERARRRAVASVVRNVAEHLGNTPAVARSAYIDPRVVERFESDDTVVDVLEELDEDDLQGGVPEELELAVVKLIDRARRSRARARRSRRGAQKR